VTRRVRAGSVTVALAAVLTGCGGVEADGVRAVVSEFADPGTSPEARCDLLAPGTRSGLEADEESSCPEVLPQLPLGTGAVEQVQVWGEEAQARLADDTLFLTRTGDGWRVLAGACRPQGPELPYRCRLEAS
jgi:hypothetical protein